MRKMNSTVNTIMAKVRVLAGRFSYAYFYFFIFGKKWNRLAMTD